MVRINATLRIVAVLLGWTPTCLVEEHIKHVPLLALVDVVESLVQVAELEEALRDKVVLDALVLKVAVHGLYELQVGEREAYELVRCLVLVESYYKWPIKPIVAKKLQFLSVVIPCQCLL